MTRTICFAFCLLAPAAQAAKSLSLKEAILLSLRHNVAIQNTKLSSVLDKFNLEVAQDKYELNYALTGSTMHSSTTIDGVTSVDKTVSLTPSMSLLTPLGTTLSASLSNTHDRTHAYAPQLTFDAKQPLLKGFGPTIAMAPLRNAEDAFALSRLQRKEEVSQQISLTIDNYLAVVTAKNRLWIQQEAYKSALRSQKKNEAMIRAGQMAPNDNMPQRQQVASTRLALMQAKNSLNTAKNTLLKTLGVFNPNVHFKIPNTLPLVAMTIPSLDDGFKSATHGNTVFLRQQITLKQQARALTLAKDNARWDLDLEAKATTGGGNGFASLHDGQDHSRQVSLNLSIPIDDSSLEQSVLSAKIAWKNQKRLLEQFRYELRLNVQEQINTLKSRRQQALQAHSAVVLAEKSLFLEQKKLEYGRSTALNVTNLRENLVKARIALNESEMGFFQARKQYRLLLGGLLNAWDIHLVDADRTDA